MGGWFVGRFWPVAGPLVHTVRRSPFGAADGCVNFPTRVIRSAPSGALSSKPCVNGVTENMPYGVNGICHPGGGHAVRQFASMVGFLARIGDPNAGVFGGTLDGQRRYVPKPELCPL